MISPRATKPWIPRIQAVRMWKKLVLGSFAWLVWIRTSSWLLVRHIFLKVSWTISSVCQCCWRKDAKLLNATKIWFEFSFRAVTKPWTSVEPMTICSTWMWFRLKKRNRSKPTTTKSWCLMKTRTRHKIQQTTTRKKTSVKTTLVLLMKARSAATTIRRSLSLWARRRKSATAIPVRRSWTQSKSIALMNSAIILARPSYGR